LATTAGGVITAAYQSSGFVFTNAQEFGSFSARYSQYRVKWIKLSFFACHPAQVPTAGVTADHGIILVSTNEENIIAASGPLVMAGRNRRLEPTYKSFTYTATWAGNPDAKLWNPTTAQIPTANSFAIQYGTPLFATNPLVASTTYYAVTTEWCVQFRGEQ
jgi:hypothetical protein